MFDNLNNLYKKYEGLFKLIVMVAPLIFAVWKYFGEYINLPDRQRAIEAKIERLDKRLREDSIYLENDYRDIEKLKHRAGL